MTRTPTYNDKLAALHEAGHSVMCELVGGRVQWARLDEVEVRLPDMNDAEVVCAIKAAGPGAVLAWDRHARLGDDHDRQSVWDQFGEDLRALYPLTVKMYRNRPDVWQAVCETAEELLAKRFLWGLQVRTICRQHRIIP